MSDTTPGHESNPQSQIRPRYGSVVELRIVDHPLVAHKLTVLRDETTDSPTFRRLTEELVTLLAYEATRNVRVTPAPFRRPASRGRGEAVGPTAVGGADPASGPRHARGHDPADPHRRSWIRGLVRNEETLVATTYAERLPNDLTGRQCYILDPMLATGGTLASAVQFLVKRGADHITCICLIAAPEGIARLNQLLEELQVPAPWYWPASTRSSTTSATSFPASATLVIVSTASSNADLSASRSASAPGC